MGKENDLIGETVMVDPAVAKAGERKKVGVVHSIVPEKGHLRIAFENGQYAEYKKHQLFILYPKAVILQGLVSNWEIADQDCKAILNVIRLVQKKQLAEALFLATRTETTKFFCVTNCAQWLDMKVKHERKVSKRNGK